MSDHQTRSPGTGDTTDVARQEAQQVAGTAQDAATSVGQRAADKGRAISSDATSHARNIARNAQEQLRGHADEETRRAGAALSTAGDQLQALAEGRPDDAGAVGEYVRQAASAVNRWADTIEDRGFDGILDDLRTFGRRRPGMFLLGALTAGVVAGRFGRNAAQELSDDDHDGQRSAIPARRSGDESYGTETTGVHTGDVESSGVQTTGGESDAARPPQYADVDEAAAAYHPVTSSVDDFEAGRPADRDPSPPQASDDGGSLIVGYATDDSDVVADPAPGDVEAGGHDTAFDDQPSQRSADSDRESSW